MDLPTLPALRVLPERFAVCKLPAHLPLPEWAMQNGPLFSLTRTASELSLVVSEDALPPEESEPALHVEAGWRALEVSGPLPFALVGILANLTVPLARAGVPVFALSTFDTDYLLVKNADLSHAIAALEAAHVPVSPKTA